MNLSPEYLVGRNPRLLLAELNSHLTLMSGRLSVAQKKCKSDLSPETLELLRSSSEFVITVGNHLAETSNSQNGALEVLVEPEAYSLLIRFLSDAGMNVPTWLKENTAPTRLDPKRLP